jgi:dihydrolipoamide dehydrogenase
LNTVREAGRFGISLDQTSVKPDLAKIMARKDAVVEQNVGGIEALFKSYGIANIKGQGILSGPGRVGIKNGRPELTELTANNIIIATGSAISRLPVPGVDLEGVTDSNRILSLKHIPRSIVIVGAGIIGVEWAGILAPLGTRVTLLEALPTILSQVDEEVVRRFGALLTKKGVNIQTGATVTAIEKNPAAKDAGDQLKLCYILADGQENIIKAEMVMLAVGRVPYTDGLGLSELGVALNRRAVLSNERMETNIKGIYAIGDVTQRVMLAHVASHEGEVAVDNIMGHSRWMDYRAVPNCIYSSPEIASVGPTEQELKAAGIAYRVSKFPFTALGRAVTLGDTNGLVKLLVSEDRGQILAGHLMGPDATDLIAELVLAVKERLTAQELAQTIHAHPTLSEAVQEAALGAVPGASAIHFRKSRI